MHIDARTKRILAGITREQWEAIESLSREMVRSSTNIFKDGKIQENQFNKDDLNEKLSRLLEELGAKIHLSGYVYFKEAVIMVYDDESYSKCMCKRLYPEIAKKYNEEWTSVNSAIDNFLRPIFKQKYCESLEKLFKYYPDLREKNSNKYAITAFVGYLKKI